MNTIIYIAIYLLINVLITLIVPAARNQFREFIKGLPQYYKRIDWNFGTSSSMRIMKKILMTLILGMFFCLIFLFILPLLPALIKRDKQRLLQEKEYEREYGFMQKTADKVVAEGFVQKISPIKSTASDSNKIYIDIFFAIYSQNGGSKYCRVICWNSLAKEIERTINRHCKIRVEGKFETVKFKDSQGKKRAIDVILAEKIELLRVEEPLTFTSTGGAGTIQCFDCKHEEEIISFIHGAGYSAGVQCQSCGKFSTLNNKPNEDVYCNCGGRLERDNSLFCPKCKSKRLTYEMHYIT